MAMHRGKILASGLDVKIRYVKPLFEAWHQYGRIVATLFDAFARWGVRSEDILTEPEAKVLGTKPMTFRLLDNRLFFTVAIDEVVIKVLNPGWSEVEALRNVVEAGIAGLGAATGAVLGSADVNLTFHVTPEGVTPRELTSKFVRLPSSKHEIEATNFGFAIYRQDVAYVVDNSLLYPSSLFIRITRRFPEKPDMGQAASTLLGDQRIIMDLLELEEAI